MLKITFEEKFKIQCLLCNTGGKKLLG